jgi:hypothetical protein
VGLLTSGMYGKVVQWWDSRVQDQWGSGPVEWVGKCSSGTVGCRISGVVDQVMHYPVGGWLAHAVVRWSRRLWGDGPVRQWVVDQ